MTVNEDLLGFGLLDEQKKQFEDTIFIFGADTNPTDQTGELPKFQPNVV